MKSWRVLQVPKYFFSLVSENAAGRIVGVTHYCVGVPSTPSGTLPITVYQDILYLTQVLMFSLLSRILLHPLSLQLPD